MIIRKIPAILVMIGICFLSSLPSSDPLLNSFLFSDKLKHFIAYFILGISFCLWIPNKKWLAKPFVWGIVVVVLCTAFGIVDEYHQSHIPGRSGNDLKDIAADFFGGFASAFVYILAIKIIIPWRAPKP